MSKATFPHKCDQILIPLWLKVFSYNLIWARYSILPISSFAQTIYMYTIKSRNIVFEYVSWINCVRIYIESLIDQWVICYAITNHMLEPCASSQAQTRFDITVSIIHHIEHYQNSWTWTVKSNCTKLLVEGFSGHFFATTIFPDVSDTCAGPVRYTHVQRYKCVGYVTFETKITLVPIHREQGIANRLRVSMSTRCGLQCRHLIPALNSWAA